MRLNILKEEEKARLKEALKVPPPSDKFSGFPIKGESKEDFQMILWLVFPDLREKVFFSDHAAQRIVERFDGKLNHQARKAIVDAILFLEEHPKKKYKKGKRFGGDFVVSRDTFDDTYLVITSWNPAKGE